VNGHSYIINEYYTSHSNACPEVKHGWLMGSFWLLRLPSR
jgi:hypothetical protein